MTAFIEHANEDVMTMTDQPDLIEKLANRLTYFQVQELRALQRTNDCIKGPTFMHRSAWRTGYQSLHRLGMVTWQPSIQDFDPRRFAGTEITELGRAVLARITEIEAGEDFSDDYED